jgi:hypothetical protein
MIHNLLHIDTAKCMLVQRPKHTDLLAYYRYTSNRQRPRLKHETPTADILGIDLL